MAVRQWNSAAQPMLTLRSAYSLRCESCIACFVVGASLCHTYVLLELAPVHRFPELHSLRYGKVLSSTGRTIANS